MSLKTLVRARDDAVYAVRQEESKAYNMRTWAISSRRQDGTTSKKMAQWDTEAQMLEVDSRPMIFLPTSAILEARKTCPVRPTSIARQELINRFKPNAEANKAVRELLSKDADDYVARHFHSSALGLDSALPPPSFAAHLVKDVLLPLREYETELAEELSQSALNEDEGRRASPSAESVQPFKLSTALANETRAYGPRTVLHKAPMPQQLAGLSPFRSSSRSPQAAGNDPSGDVDAADFIDIADESAVEGHRALVRTAAPSMAETKLPEHNEVSYRDLYDEQKILKEQQEIHREAYEEAKALYVDECRFVKSCITSMVDGRFFDEHDGAVGTRRVPVVEMGKMRLQRDSVPVMVVQHDE